MVAVFVAVVDVFSVSLALDAHLLIQGDVSKLDGHQGLQVHGVQQLAVVRVVLKGETVAYAEITDLPDPVFVLRSLETKGGIKIWFDGENPEDGEKGGLGRTLALQWMGITLGLTLPCRASGRDSLEGACEEKGFFFLDEHLA